MLQQIELEMKNLNFYYSGNIHSLKNFNLSVCKNKVTALIGPS